MSSNLLTTLPAGLFDSMGSLTTLFAIALSSVPRELGILCDARAHGGPCRHIGNNLITELQRTQFDGLVSLQYLFDVTW